MVAVSGGFEERWGPAALVAFVEVGEMLAAGVVDFARLVCGASEDSRRGKTGGFAAVTGGFAPRLGEVGSALSWDVAISGSPDDRRGAVAGLGLGVGLSLVLGAVGFADDAGVDVAAVAAGKAVTAAAGEL